MSSVTLSYEELEALHDVLEAARCFWYPQQAHRSRAAETLQLANRLYWRIGEYLPKTGTPSKRYVAVAHSAQGDRVEQFLDFMVDLMTEYSNANDPWWADTIFAPNSITNVLSQEELHKLRDSLGRLGLTLELRADVPHDQMIATRRNIGPWPQELSR